MWDITAAYFIVVIASNAFGEKNKVENKWAKWLKKLEEQQNKHKESRRKETIKIKWKLIKWKTNIR